MTKVKIAIEYLIDAVTTYFDNYEDYIKTCKVWKYDTEEKRREHIRSADKWQSSAWDTIVQLGYVLGFTEEQMERLFVCAKAVRNWRKRTDYMFCMSSDMKQNIAGYIFGKEEINWYVPMNQREVEFV